MSDVSLAYIIDVPRAHKEVIHLSVRSDMFPLLAKSRKHRFASLGDPGFGCPPPI
jgi:hypothetical protein